MSAPITKAVAYNSSNVALLAIKSQRRKNLAGWAWFREDVETGKRTWMQTMVAFKGQNTQPGEKRDSTIWPIQKPVWKDFECPQGRQTRWGACPVYFDASQASAVRCDQNDVTMTKPVVLKTNLDDEIEIAFNLGFLSTQWLAAKCPKKPDGSFDYATLAQWLSTPGNAVRIKQAGDILPMLVNAIKQARAEGGRIYLILYEFTDPELLALVLANADIITVILGNAPTDDSENGPTRKALKAGGVTVIDRFIARSGIPHNKVLIYADAKGEMMYVIGGGTNWTFTGMTTQINVQVKIHSPDLAKLQKKAFDLLAKDSAMNPTQSAWLRARFAVKPPIVVLKSGARVQAFFSPNTKWRTKPKGPHPLPIDRAFTEMLLKQVDEAATGLFFLPGDPSDLNGFRWLEENKPDLALLELAVNGFQALQKGDVLLKHRPGQPAVAVVASAIEKGFADFLTEVLKLPDAHAMIHEKSIEADARHKNRWKVWCVYRSHNGGDKASISNDEHQYFVFGHRGLNIAFMVHHIDVCDHNRFRMMVNQNSKDDSLMGYLSQDDTWQDKYFVEGGAPMRELDYLTRDDDYDDDAPVPDFLKEDPDPKAFDKWGDVGADWEAEAHAADLAELSDAGITNDEPTKAGPSTPVDPDAADKKPEKPPSRHPPHGGSRAHCDAAKATPKQSATSRLRALAKRCFGG